MVSRAIVRKILVSMVTVSVATVSVAGVRAHLRRVERHCTRPTTILKIAETCRGEG